MSRTIESCIENYLVGNLTDAKKQAKQLSWKDIYIALRDDYARPDIESRTTADYLKGTATFREAANAETKRNK